MWIHVSQKYKLALWTTIGLLCAIVCIVCGVAFSILNSSLSVILLTCLGIALATIWFFWWSGRHARVLKYAVAEDGFKVSRGIMIKKTYSVPYGRIQYIEASSNPITRHFDLQKLHVHTAGSVKGVIGLAGLQKDVATALHQELNVKAEEDLARL